MYIHDESRLKQIIDLFLEFVSKKNNGEKASFSNGYLFTHEGYKAAVYVRANDILKPETWNKNSIQSGEIARRADAAIHVSGNNFTGWRSKDNFRKIAQSRPVEAGQAIVSVKSDPHRLQPSFRFIMPA